MDFQSQWILITVKAGVVVPIVMGMELRIATDHLDLYQLEPVFLLLSHHPSAIVLPVMVRSSESIISFFISNIKYIEI
jgi:hypothetical protein